MKLEIIHCGHRAVVEKSETHPEGYMWIRVDRRKLFFLGVLENGMTRGDVRRKAVAFVERAHKEGLI